MAYKEDERLNHRGGGNARIPDESLSTWLELDPKGSVILSFG